MNEIPDTSIWIQELQDGKPEAVSRLWNQYHSRLIDLARKRLGDLPRRVADEEDVALSAFDSFCRGAEKGKFRHLEDKNDLWQLLVMITVRKVADLRQSERRAKRGSGLVRGESALFNKNEPDIRGIDNVEGDEPTPEFVALVADQCRSLLECLTEESLRQIALAKVEGYTNAEIARHLKLSIPTIERKLRRIRTIWENRISERE